MALTKRQVDAFRYDPKGPVQQVLYDDELPVSESASIRASEKCSSRGDRW